MSSQLMQAPPHRSEVHIHCVMTNNRICYVHGSKPAVFWDDADAEKFAAYMRERYPHKNYRVKDIRVL